MGLNGMENLNRDVELSDLSSMHGVSVNNHNMDQPKSMCWPATKPGA